MSDSPQDLASEWKTELGSRTTVEKVYDVILQLNDSLRVSEIADRAGVAPDTARKYLEFLKEMGVAKKIGDDPVTYSRNNSYLEWRNIDRLQREYTIEELNNRLSELSDTISSFQELYDAANPITVVPQEHGYENIDETMDDLRQWEAAREEVDEIVEALGRGQSASNMEAVNIAEIVRIFQQLQSIQSVSNINTIPNIQTKLSTQDLTKSLLPLKDRICSEKHEGDKSGVFCDPGAVYPYSQQER